MCAQLSYGLSTEYSKQPQASGQSKVDADRDKYAKFYVHQILSMGEEGIRDAYRRVSAACYTVGRRCFTHLSRCQATACSAQRFTDMEMDCVQQPSTHEIVSNPQRLEPTTASSSLPSAALVDQNPCLVLKRHGS